MKLIELEELQKYPIRWDTYDRKNGNKHFVNGIESLMEFAESLPTINPEDMRAKGRWIERPDERICPFCGYRRSYFGGDNDNFCPNCGAKMEE